MSYGNRPWRPSYSQSTTGVILCLWAFLCVGIGEIWPLRRHRSISQESDPVTFWCFIAVMIGIGAFMIGRSLVQTYRRR